MSLYSDEVAVARELQALLSEMAQAGLSIKLGHIPDEQRSRLTGSQATLMRRHKLDILRVLLAQEMVAEAKELKARWLLCDNRTSQNGRRYGDLLFSARALLPPGYDWDDVTYEGPEGKVCWSHQLTYDRNGRQIEGAAYDPIDAEQLLNEHKGDERPMLDEE